MVAVSFTDIEGADMIRTVTEEMARDGIQVHSEVFNFLKEDGVIDIVGVENVHEDLYQAVETLKKSSGSADD